jgi:lipoprotein NlpD
MTLSLATLTGCSSFVQQAAPVEAPTQTQVYRGTSNTPAQAGNVPSEQAQSTPYRADEPMRSSATVVPHTVSADDGKTHVVQPGENLFRISLSHGLKYQVVASWNNLPDPSIKVGQVLRLTPPGTGQNSAATTPAEPVNKTETAAATLKPYPKALKLAYSATALQALAAQSEGSNPRPATTAVASDSSAPLGKVANSHKAASEPLAAKSAGDSSAPKASAEDLVAWGWPSNGKVLRGYSDSNKGIDISGRMGQSVLAAGDGKVVYSGSGLRGYGKLIIIKHNKTFLSAYAHNSQLSVKEGQTIKKGQKIAEMGNTDADQVKLHFEIRRFGKPIDPMQYLNSKP